MRPRNIPFLFAIALGPVVSPQTATGQDDKIKIAVPPLNVTAEISTGLGTECKAGRGLVAHLHYVGTQPLRGYLVEFVFFDQATHQPIETQSIQDVRNLREPMIADGAEWTRTVCSIPENRPADALIVHARVDVLKFVDGSIWGPASLPESHQLIGTIDGMDFSMKTTDLLRYVSPILPRGGPVPVEDIEIQTIGPLRIGSGVWHEGSGTAMVAVEATNAGAAPIRGFVFTTSFFDPNSGAPLRSVTTKELETQGNPSHYLLPGASWVAGPRKFSYLPDGSRASYKITLDLVVFADGSTFGPKKSRESDEVLGMFRGIDLMNLASHGAPAAQSQ
ncbi:MAG TPA: hypothetical protein VIX91_25740 [Candidatus Acidoferrum sp.]